MIMIYNDMTAGMKRYSGDAKFRAAAANVLKSKGLPTAWADKHEPDGRDSPTTFVDSIIFSFAKRQAMAEERGRNDADLYDAAAEMVELLTDALGVHIYSAEDDELPDADCRYVASIQRVRAALGLPLADIKTEPPVGAVFALRFGRAGMVAGTIASARFDTRAAADADILDLMARQPSADWVEIVELDAAGVPIEEQN